MQIINSIGDNLSFISSLQIYYSQGINLLLSYMYKKKYAKQTRSYST